MRGYTHLSVLWHSTLPYMVIYVIMHHGASLYVYFTLKASLYTVFNTPTLALHHTMLLYHTMRGYTLMRGYTHLYVLRHSTLPYMVVYVAIHHVRAYTYIFTLQAWLYTVLRTPTIALHQMWLYAWRGYITPRVVIH